jgi:hypothetical protein
MPEGGRGRAGRWQTGVEGGPALQRAIRFCNWHSAGPFGFGCARDRRRSSAVRSQSSSQGARTTPSSPCKQRSMLHSRLPPRAAAGGAARRARAGGTGGGAPLHDAARRAAPSPLSGRARRPRAAAAARPHPGGATPAAAGLPRRPRAPPPPPPRAAAVDAPASGAGAAGAAALLRGAGYWAEGSVPSGATLEHDGDLVIHGAARAAQFVAAGCCRQRHSAPRLAHLPRPRASAQQTAPSQTTASAPHHHKAPSPRARRSWRRATSSASARCRALPMQAPTWGQAPTRRRASSRLSCAARGCASRTRARSATPRRAGRARAAPREQRALLPGAKPRQHASRAPSQPPPNPPRPPPSPQVTLPGPHCAFLAASGASSVIQLQPLGRSRPAPGIAAVGSSFRRWRRCAGRRGERWAPGRQQRCGLPAAVWGCGL